MDLRPARLGLLAALAVPLPLAAQAGGGEPADAAAAPCPMCAEWNAPQRPFRIHGNAWYVGPRGLGAVLVASDEGHVLIDGGLPESAPLIIDNIRALGFRIEDVELILNSHPHFDHAGGIAALQRASGAVVAASPASAPVLERGESGPDDPQYGLPSSLPPVRDVRVIADGERLRVGPLELTAHFTPGHTPGGTTWSWTSCDAGRCLDLVYADSQTPVSADGFLFTRSRTYPSAVEDFERGHAVLERLSCDVLVTTHPGASRLWERLSAREAGEPDALVDPGACRAYAAAARRQLARRLESERAQVAQVPDTDVFLVEMEAEADALRFGAPENVTARPGYDNQPSFTPDGAAILYTAIGEAGQADVWRYDLERRARTRVTATAESEYSPTVMPDGAGISVVMVEADSTQRLWRIDPDGGEPRPILRDVAPVGYHAWADAHTLALFVLGDPPTLRLADVRTGEAVVIQERIGRSLHRIPGRRAVSFVHKEAEAPGAWWIAALEPETGAVERLVRVVGSGEDYAWTPDGAVLMAEGSRLYRWDPRRAEAGWEEVADFAAAGVAEITRLAVAPGGDRLAFVARPAR